MPFSGYDTLNRLAPSEFLNWEQFLTPFDGARAEGRRLEQYRKGFDKGVASEYVAICANGTWSAKGKDGSHTFSYEGIGYHAGTADLLHGFLDSGVPIVVYRDSDSGQESAWIRGTHPETVADIGRTDRPIGAASVLSDLDSLYAVALNTPEG